MKHPRTPLGTGSKDGRELNDCSDSHAFIVGQLVCQGPQADATAAKSLREVVTRIFTTWNPLITWLHQLNGLRAAA
jgi:hypothetical protein